MNNDLVWEECECDWCGSIETKLIFEGPDRLERLPGIFQLIQCQNCGIYRQNPRLAWVSLKDYYPETYASHPKLVRDEASFIRRVDKRYGPWKRLKAIEKYQDHGKLLEIGCGTGHFLEEVLRSGKWQATGVEPSIRAAEYAKEKLKIPIHQNRFREEELPENSFDVIVFWNVVEHLDTPIDDLRYARSLLKDGGLLVFSVPNLDSMEAHLFGKYWVGWDLPRHLYLFPTKNIHAILGEIGFQLFDSRCISTSYSVLGHTLDFWSQSWMDRFPTLRKLLLRTYYNFIMRAALVPPLWLLDRLNRSTIITFFAIKT